MSRSQLAAALTTLVLVVIAVTLLLGRPISTTAPAVRSFAASPGAAKQVSVGRPMTASNGEAMTVTGVTGSDVDAPGGVLVCFRVALSLSNHSGGVWTLPLSEVSGVAPGVLGGPEQVAFGFGICPDPSNIASVPAGGRDTAYVYFDSVPVQPVIFTWSSTETGEVFQTPLGEFS